MAVSSQAGTTTGGTAGTSSSSRYDAGAFDAYRPDTRDAVGGTKYDASVVDAYRADLRDAWRGGTGGSSSSGGAGSSGSRDAWVPDSPLPDAYVPDAPVDTATGGTGGASSSSSSSSSGGSGGATSLAAPKIDSFNVSSGSQQGTEITVSAGKSVTFLWSVSDAITKSIDQGVGDVTGASKTITVPSPSAETTYTFKLIVTNSTNDAGTTFDKAEATVKVIVVPLSIASFTANPAFINSGESSTLTAVYAGTGATINHDVGAVTSSVGASVSPTEAATYSVTVTNRLGDTVKADVTVNVLGLDASADTSP
jgi:hypothetical protein